MLQWGTLGNVRKAQHVRPDFRGELKTNPVTGQLGSVPSRTFCPRLWGLSGVVLMCAGQVEKYYSRKWRYPWFLLRCMLIGSFLHSSSPLRRCLCLNSTLVTLCMLSVSFVLMVCSLNAQVRLHSRNALSLEARARSLCPVAHQAYTQMDSESPLYVEELDKLSRAGAIFDQNSYVMW